MILPPRKCDGLLFAAAVLATVLLMLAVILRPSLLNGAEPATSNQQPATSNLPSRPALGLSLPCEIIDVVDGDTLTARVTLTVRVRLLDCWAPETRTRNAREKVLGLASRDALKAMAEGQRGVLYVPLSDVRRMDDALSLSRVLGYVWIDEPAGAPDVATRQQDAGHAFRTKDELLRALAL